MKEISHRKRLLLVEDQEEIYAPLSRWLAEEAYQVTLAFSLPEALAALETGHFHLAIVDIRLQADDQQNQDGMTLLEAFERRGLNGVMPCVVLTAHANVENVLLATQVRRVDRFIEKKTGYKGELLTAVQTLFNEKISVNFDLVYDLDTEQIIPQIAASVSWSDAPKPDKAILIPQVYDLFGRLFARAKRLYVAKLTPGLTGAAVVRAQPTWNHGVGPSYVIKIGRRDKVKLEAQRYDDYVKPYLPADTTTQVDVVFTQHLGALQYRFAESDTGPLKEFDLFYKSRPATEIIASLQNLFQNTCRYWYDNTERRYEDLTRLYYAAFQLSESRFRSRFQEILPGFTPDQPLLRLPPDNAPIVNPIAWLNQHSEERKMPIYHCITHGDLTGRNIMVSEKGRCWLIDFYRTHESHILRDFVILETDIKYRLLPTPDRDAFTRLEQFLFMANGDEADTHSLPPALQKAAQVLLALRHIAYDFLRDRDGARQDTRKEYLISLLMATLNVVRLQHIPGPRKVQAMRSASFICAELDKLAGREPFEA